MWLKKKKKKKKKEQGGRISKKRGKAKLPCNKKCTKCDLKYIHKELSMNLQLRSDNENILKQSRRGRAQKNSVKYEYQICDYMCTFK